jgi:hypothetical protein
VKLCLTRTATCQLDQALSDNGRQHPQGAPAVKTRIPAAMHRLLNSLMQATTRRGIRRVIVSR